MLYSCLMFGVVALELIFEEYMQGFGLLDSMLCEGFGKENKVGFCVCVFSVWA